LISKCIACMPQVALISEVNPCNVGQRRFNPFDPVQQLFSQNLISYKEETLKEIFKNRIKIASKLAEENNKLLVLRDHTASDYLSKMEPRGFREKSLINTLFGDFRVLSVLTVRNPVDSYLSIRKNGWHDGIKHFDEYCSRFLMMLDAYKNVPVYKYEDFCADPDAVLEKICVDMDIQFDASYRNQFHQINLTGDSGRGREVREIKTLPRRDYSEEYLSEVAKSRHFKKISKRLAYYAD